MPAGSVGSFEVLPATTPDSVRRVVLAGPGAAAAVVAPHVLPAVIDARSLAWALAGSGHRDTRRRDLSGAVSAVLLLGLCLFSGEGYPIVLQR